MADDFDIHQLYGALDQKRAAQGLTWAGVARELDQHFTKVAAGTIKGIRDKHAVEGDGVLQMLLWLGRSPESFMPGATADQPPTLASPESGVLRFDVAKTYRLLHDRRRQHNLTWAEVAHQIGACTPGMLQRFKTGGRTSFPLIMRIARWLEVSAQELTKVSPR